MRMIMAMMVAALSTVAPGISSSQSIDPGDCQDRADRLRKDARDLADAAAALETDDLELQRAAEADVRIRSEAVRSSFSQVAKACGALATYPAVIASIRRYLELAHGNTPATRDRIKAVDEELVSLAQVHVKAQPVDFRMTYALAEVIFTATER